MSPPSPSPAHVVRDVLLAFGALAALSACFFLGIAPSHRGLHGSDLLLFPGALLGAVTMTVPVLFVAWPTLQLHGGPEQAIEAVGDGIRRLGRLTWGLLPLLGFATLTTEGAFLLILLAIGLSGVLGLAAAIRALVAAEGPHASIATRVRVGLAALAWAVLTALVDVRLTLSLFDLPASF